MSQVKRKKPAAAPAQDIGASTSTGESDDNSPRKAAKMSTDPSGKADPERGLKLGTVLEPMETTNEDDSDAEEDEEMDAGPTTSSKFHQPLLDFSSNELPKEVSETLDDLLRRITDIQQLVDQWVKMTPADRAVHV